MALYLTGLLDEPNVLYSNVGGLSGFVKGKKSDICAYTDPVPRFRAAGMSSWALWFLFLLFFLTAIWPTFSLWTFPPSLLCKTPVKQRSPGTANHPSWCTSFQSVDLSMPLAYWMQFISCSLSVSGWQKHAPSSPVLLSDSVPAQAAHISCLGLRALLQCCLCSCSIMSCPSFSKPWFPRLCHSLLCLQGTGKSQPVPGVIPGPETGWADKWNQSQQGALPPQGNFSIPTLLILLKPTLQEISVGKNLATPV